ncbi:MAG: DUF3857 domain-containing protein, partial [Bacteroidota bacterium]|nr:DUF3857 domain-containing protein [Bacteroidota bacterium]
MKHFNIITLLAALLILSSCQINKEPDTDAVFKNITKVYQLNNDGSVNYQYQHELKYLTHYAFNRAYGETFVIYNPKKQDLTINKAETRMSNGKIVESPDNALNEILPHTVIGSPEYNHLREMVITHVGLEVGATVNLDYEIKTETGYYPFLADNIVLNEKSPVQNQKIVVKIPKDKTLNYKLLNSNVEPKISDNNNFTIYTWKFNDISASTQDYSKPHEGSYLPRLIFSTSDMKNALADLKNNTDIALSENIKTKVNKALQETEKTINKITTIKKILANINTINVPIEHTGYKPNSLKHIWESNRATVLEKNLLFIELLKHANINAELLFAYPTFSFDKKIGNLKDFGHYYVKTKLDSQAVILSLDTKQKNDLAFNLEKTILVNINGEIVDLCKNISDIENKLSFVTNLKLAKDGSVKGDIKAKIVGEANPYFDLLKDENNAKQIISSVAKNKMIEDFELENFDFSSSNVTATIKCNEIWEKQGNYYFINLPNSTLGIKKSYLYALGNNRNSPLKLNSKINETYEYGIKLPDSLHFVNPVKQELTNEIGSVVINSNLDNNI